MANQIIACRHPPLEGRSQLANTAHRDLERPNGVKQWRPSRYAIDHYYTNYKGDKSNLTPLAINRDFHREHCKEYLCLAYQCVRKSFSFHLLHKTWQSVHSVSHYQPRMPKKGAQSGLSRSCRTQNQGQNQHIFCFVQAENEDVATSERSCIEDPRPFYIFNVLSSSTVPSAVKYNHFSAKFIPNISSRRHFESDLHLRQLKLPCCRAASVLPPRGILSLQRAEAGASLRSFVYSAKVNNLYVHLRDMKHDVGLNMGLNLWSQLTLNKLMLSDS